MPEKQLLSISELTNVLNLTLEDYIGEVAFEGELSEINRASSGHLYLCLKDELSQISAVVWASKARTLRFNLEAGLRVQCRGKANVYPRTGRLQIVLSALEPAGVGDLQKRFEALKKKLSDEGLFAQERKRPLPFLPKAIGIVTSAQGAVIHDIMVRLQERMPQLKVYLMDVKVQGPGAAEEIANAIAYLERTKLVDVMIVGRGGGSLEDLWAFNEEVVCRAIAKCSVPIISAVGHEVDFTLADFVADLRAPTPTAAAEMVAPRRADLLLQLDEFERRLRDTDRWLARKQQDFDTVVTKLETVLRKVVDVRVQSIERLESRLVRYEPRNLLIHLQNQLTLQRTKLTNATYSLLLQGQNRLQLVEARVRAPRFIESLVSKKQLVAQHAERLLGALQHRMSHDLKDLDSLLARLHALNPERVLERGYAMVLKEGRIVTTKESLQSGDAIQVRLRDGAISSSVTSIE